MCSLSLSLSSHISLPSPLVSLFSGFAFFCCFLSSLYPVFSLFSSLYPCSLPPYIDVSSLFFLYCSCFPFLSFRSVFAPSSPPPLFHVLCLLLAICVDRFLCLFFLFCFLPVFISHSSCVPLFLGFLFAPLLLPRLLSHSLRFPCQFSRSHVAAVG